MENITFEEFKKLDLRVGEIKAAEDIVRTLYYEHHIQKTHQDIINYQ